MPGGLVICSVEYSLLSLQVLLPLCGSSEIFVWTDMLDFHRRSSVRPYLPPTTDVLHHLGFQRRVRRARGARTSVGDEARARWQRAVGLPGAGAVRQGPGQVLRGFERERHVYTPTHGT